MSRKTIAVSIAAALMGGGSASALANDGKAYFGFGLGQTKIDFPSGAEIDQVLVGSGVVATSSTSVDETGNAWKAFIGYRFHENFGIEGGWVDLGEADFETVTTGPAATFGGSAEAQGPFVDAVGFIPINDRFTVFGKVGLLAADVEVKAAVASGGSAVSSSADDNDVATKFGVGVSYNFDNNFGIRAEYERYNDVGDEDSTGETDVDLWMISVYAGF